MSQLSALLSEKTSRRNKIWLLQNYIHRGILVEWKWSGVPFKSRLQVRPTDQGASHGWLTCKSFDEDVLPTYEFNATRVCKV